MSRYTTISEEDLKRYLSKIRRISKMEDSDAIEELDEFIFNLCATDYSTKETLNTEEPTIDYRKEGIERELNVLSNRLKKYSNKLESNTCSIYDANGE